MSFKLLTKQNAEFLGLKGSYTFKMQCEISHVEVHMYVLQHMHEYTVNIDDTLMSNFMYLQLVLLKLNISTCYWCSFLRINTRDQSMPYKAVTVKLPPNFVLSLIFTVHYQMQPTVCVQELKPQTSNWSTLTQYRSWFGIVSLGIG